MRAGGSNRVPPSLVRAVIGRTAELEAIDAFLGTRVRRAAGYPLRSRCVIISA
jgi:hypothetical protein